MLLDVLYLFRAVRVNALNKKALSIQKISEFLFTRVMQFLGITVHKNTLFDFKYIRTSSHIKTSMYNMPIFINLPSSSGVQRSVLRCSPLVKKILSELLCYNLVQQIERSTVSSKVDEYGYNWLKMTHRVSSTD